MKEVTKEEFDAFIAEFVKKIGSWHYYGEENRMYLRTGAYVRFAAVEFGYGYSVQGERADQVANKYYVNRLFL